MEGAYISVNGYTPANAHVGDESNLAITFKNVGADPTTGTTTVTLTAERQGILLIREVDGKQEHYKIDLKDSHLLDSPYFYLQQNDVIVVPASPSRVTAATTNTGIWSVLLSSVTTAIAVISMIITVSK